MENKVEMVQMTPEELAEYKRFVAEKDKKEKEQQFAHQREDYKILVEEIVDKSLTKLQTVSSYLVDVKATVLSDFDTLIAMKAELFGLKKEEQKSHTFSNADNTIRVLVGNYTVDNYRDTVNEGIAMVKEVVKSLARDEESAALVDAILKLLSKDKQGNLKASKVVELSELADKINNDKLRLGVKIIRESYMPLVSKRFIRIMKKDPVTNEFKDIPLGMTEA